MEFLLRPKPHFQEGWLSWLHRVAKANYFEHPQVFYQTLRKKITEAGLNTAEIYLPRNETVYSILASLLATSPDIIHEMTIHRFAHLFDYQDGEDGFVSDSDIRTHFWMRQQAQYCPMCLAEERYSRTKWHLKSSMICLRHQCLLLRVCPACGIGTSLKDVADGTCHVCNCELEKAKATLIHDKSFLGHEQLLESISSFPMNNSIPNLPTKTSSVIYALLCAITIALEVSDVPLTHPTSAKGATSNYHAVPSKIVRQNEAVSALAAWPQGFYDLLDRLRDTKSQVKGAYSDLGVLYSTYIERRWKYPEFQFVQDAFNRYYIARFGILPSAKKSKRYTVAIQQGIQPEIITASEAAAKLHTTTRQIQNLIEAGNLCKVDLEHGYKQTYLSLNEVNQLADKWREGITVAEIAIKLGISRSSVVGLIRVGILNALRGPISDGTQNWLVERQSLQNFTDKVAKIVSVHDKSDDVFWDIMQTTQSLAAIGFRLEQVLECVLAYKIPVYVLTELQEATIRDLRFRPCDVRHYREQHKREHDWYSIDEFAGCIKVKNVVISRWIKTNLITPDVQLGGVDYFTGSFISNFQREYVFTEEASKILGIGRLAVQKWARHGRLSPVAGPKIDGSHRYLFKRSDLLRYTPDKRLTTPLMAEKLGVSHSQLIEWIKRGKVRPVSGPGIDGFKHYLFLDET